MNGVLEMGVSEVTSEHQPPPPGEDLINDMTPPTKKARMESGTWQPKIPFMSTPVYDLTQTGDVKFGPGTRSVLLGLLGGALPKLSSEQYDTVTRAKKYAMEQSIKMVLMKQTLAHQQQQLASQRTQVQRQQALALMCRVYVGSISFELKEDTIRAAFLPFGPIKSINMSWDPITQKHKGFAFVEYEIPEGAQLALEQMNGALMGGRNIKVVGVTIKERLAVGRPSNMPQAQQVIDEIQEEAKNYNRIYVSSIHPDLTEEDIKSVFEAFGPILYCRLAQGTSLHSHKGYGFIEYATKQAMDEAIASMNLFDLGGQLLRVGRAITPPNALMGPTTNSSMPTAAAVAAAAATAKIQAMDAVASNAVLGLSAAAPTLGIPSIATVMPTKVCSAPLLPSTMQQTGMTVPSSATILIPPQVVTPILGTHGAINVTTATPTVVTTTTTTPVASTNPEDILKKAHEKQQEELQKKLLEEGEPQTLQQQESMSIKGQNARHLVMQRLMRPQDSKVIILRNMVGPEDVDETLQEEIQDECAKFGMVERVIIYKEKQSENEEDDEADVIVKIFVEFSTSVESERGREALHGRFFGGRRVIAELYDQALFDHGDLSG